MGGFFLHSLQTFRTDAMGGWYMKTFIKVVLQFHPFSIVSNFSTPCTQSKKLSEVMQPVSQPFGQAPDNRPDVDDEQSLQPTVTPITYVRTATEKPLRQTLPF